MEDIYQQAFRIKPEEFDEAFEKWLKERFKPFRDKQRPERLRQGPLARTRRRRAYTQVFAFSPSPSGEVVAALTGNRAEGEADLILLSAKDGSVHQEPDQGVHRQVREHHLQRRLRGRPLASASTPRATPSPSSPARASAAACTWSRCSTGEIVRARSPSTLDQAQAPCLLPGRPARAVRRPQGRRLRHLAASTWRRATIKNLTQDAFYDADPQVSPDGKLVAYTRRISGHDKIYVFPLDDPAQQDAAHLRRLRRHGAHVLRRRQRSSTTPPPRTTTSTTCAAWTCARGSVRQYTDALGGNMAPAVLPRQGRRARRPSSATSRASTGCRRSRPREPMKEVEQEVQVASDDEIVDFQPDVTHQVVPENKRQEAHVREAVPGGPAAAQRGRDLRRRLLRRQPGRPLRRAGGPELPAHRDLAAGVPQLRGHLLRPVAPAPLRASRGFDNTQLLLRLALRPADELLPRGRLRHPALHRRRLVIAPVPARQVPPARAVGRASCSMRERFENPFAEQQARSRRRRRRACRSSSTTAPSRPSRVALVGETTRFREFGPLAGHTYSVGLQLRPRHRRPALARTRSTSTPASTSGSAAARGARRRASAASSRRARTPTSSTSAATWSCAGYPYLSFVGQRGVLRQPRAALPDHRPHEDADRHPGPGARDAVRRDRRGPASRASPTGSAPRERGHLLRAATRCSASRSAGFHLVDGRASYGVGLQFFFLGYPLHFDWSKLTDLKVPRPGSRFDFWIGFDF